MADCTIPIISAVGHETDTTLADFAADAARRRRLPRPKWRCRCAANWSRRWRIWPCARNARHRAPVVLGRERLEARVQRLPRPEALLQPQAQRLDDLSERCGAGLSDRAAQARGLLMATRRACPRRCCVRGSTKRATGWSLRG